MDKKDYVSPESAASFWSRWTYLWLDKLMVKGKKTPLEKEDLWEMDSDRKSKLLTDKLEAQWEKERQKPNPSLLRATMDLMFWQVFPVGLLRFVSDMGTNLSPIFVKYLVNFVTTSQTAEQANQEAPSFYYGLSYALALLFIQVYITVVQNKFFQVSQTQGLMAKSAFIGLIFRKSARLSSSSRQSFNSGKVTNLVSTDCNRIEMFTGMCHVLWTSPVQMVIIIGILVSMIGPAAFAGVGLLAVLGPIQRQMMMKIQGIRKKVAPVTDSRVKLTQEIISGIRVIKFFTWEDPFSQVIEETRNNEVKLVRLRSFTQALIMALAFSVPVFAAAISLIIYGSANTLNPANIFAALALFNQLKFPMVFIPMSVVQLVDFRVAMTRIQELLMASELDPQEQPDPAMTDAIKVTEGNFYWDESVIETEQPILNNINLTIPKGSLVAVVGTVGSGKSTLLSSLIGETKKTKGRVSFAGSVGYAAQQAWIQNDTVQGNILFGLPYDQEKYLRVIRDCSLEKDFTVLPDGDLTEIGERGINLSGGQKQRVNLARLLYYNPDTILMDDPLSAVDAHVGRYLFETCISKAMDGKTRVLVTHQLHFLPQTDYIVVMKEGRIAEQGTYTQLMEAKGEFCTLMNSYGSAEHKSESDDDISAASDDQALDRIEKNMDSKAKKEKFVLTEAEDRAIGTVKTSIWLGYFKAAGSFTFLIASIVGLILYEAAQIGTNLWLVEWSNNSFPSFSTGAYVGVYLGFGLAQTLFSYNLGMIFAFFGTQAARLLHENAFKRILKSPVSFYDSTPLGRIINRFSKDLDVIDNTLPDSFRMFFSTSSDTVAIFLLIVSATPLFIVPLLVVLPLYWVIQGYYRAVSRELKRLDSLTRSPMYAHIGETLTGLGTIRAYREQDRFIQTNEHYVDHNNSPLFLLICTARWLSLRLEVLGAVLVFCCALFGILSRTSPWFSAALFGLILSYSLQVTGTLSWCIRQLTDTEIAMNAVERVTYYGSNLPQENAHITETRPEKSWPMKGEISFENIAMRYSPELPLVLKNISFKVKDNEKIGIVGRTGSGKSSIMQVLFRMVEPAEGKITIDGVDSWKIGLKDLRSKLGIIPQDPVLFSGPFRRNLDPFAEYTDQQVWTALEQANIKQKVVECGGLDGHVQEGGENLSVGQRQLLCLARALLRTPKILIMDEATANVDYETDAIIQKCIRENLSNCTILTIAHRLNTIMDYDRVLVLDAGEICEYDTPYNLLTKTNGMFRSMAEETGDQSMAGFKKLLGIVE
ncbi:hypothetical protein HDV01_006962 [Terramyces sp. JEL0728]|nr:hypothetical protein HDV01_006962 [Terramyces sp. JEL0728]